jgi:hypothetical protein
MQTRTHACTQADRQPHILSLSFPHARVHMLTRARIHTHTADKRSQTWLLHTIKRILALTLSSVQIFANFPAPLAPFPSFFRSHSSLTFDTSPFPSSSEIRQAWGAPLSFSLRCVVASASHKVAPTLTFFGNLFSQQLTRATDTCWKDTHAHTYTSLSPFSCLYISFSVML